MVFPPHQKPETVRAPIGADQLLQPTTIEKPVLPPRDSIVNAIKLRNATTDSVCDVPGIPELSPETVAAVKSSVPLLRSHGTAIVTRFYPMLFERYPSVRKHFNMDRQARGAAGAAGVPAQVSAMSRTILMYAGHIDHPEKLVDAITRICEKHVARGVTQEQYTYIGECFLTALKDVLDPGEGVLEAWRLAYEKLAGIFQKIELDITARSCRLAGYTTEGMTVTIKAISKYKEETDADDAGEGSIGKKIPRRFTKRIRAGKRDRIIAVQYPPPTAPRVRQGQFLAIRLRGVPGGVGDTMLIAPVTQDTDGGVVHLKIVANGDRANAYLIATAQVGDALSVGLPVGRSEDERRRSLQFP